MARCRAFRLRRSINVYQAFYATTNGIIASAARFRRDRIATAVLV